MARERLPGDALLSRTPAGTAELNQPSEALTLSQRKLLLLIQRGTTFQSLMDNSPSVDRTARDDDLARLFTLGFVAAVDRQGNAIDTAQQPSAGDAPGETLRLRHDAPAGDAIPAASFADDTQSVHELRDRNEALTAGSHRRSGPILVGSLALLCLVAGWIVWAVWLDDPDVVPRVEGARPDAGASPVTQRPLYPDEIATPAASVQPSSNQPAPVGGIDRARNEATAGRTSAAADSTKMRRDTPEAARASAPSASGAVAVPQPISTAAPIASAAGISAASAPASASPSITSEPDSAKPSPAAAAAPPAAAEPRVAAAAPSSARIAVPARPRIIVRIDPEFPPDAARQGITSGTVRARMKVDADGNVTAVEVVESRPSRTFDRAVLRALAQWKFEATGTARSVDHEVEFR